MSIKGGYKIIDFKNEAFTAGTKKTIAGIYNSIESNYGKPLVMSGVKIGTSKYGDHYVNLVAGNGTYTGMFDFTMTDNTSAVGILVTIANDDGVTFATTTVTSA